MEFPLLVYATGGLIVGMVANFIFREDLKSEPFGANRFWRIIVATICGCFWPLVVVFCILVCVFEIRESSKESIRRG